MNWLITAGLMAIALFIGYLIGYIIGSDDGENHAIKKITLMLKKQLLEAQMEAAETDALNWKARAEEWFISDSHSEPDHPES
jgi:hypothetical protein